jgi:hypothetical protein
MRGERAFQILVAMLVSAGPFLAQTDPCLRRSVAVNVFDNQNRITAGLTAENFRASFRRQPVKILRVTQGSAARVVIVLDASGSMLSNKSEWEFSIESAKQLSNALPPGVPLGLIVFSANVEKTIALTNDRQSIVAELDAFKTGRRAILKGLRKTALWDSMSQALSLFGSPETGDTLYVVSDGMDNASHVEINELKRAASSFRIFALVPDPFPFPNGEYMVRNPELVQLATESGGFTLLVSTRPMEANDPLFGPPQPPTFETVLTGGQITSTKDEQFRRALSFYRVEVELPTRIEKTGEWSLKATASNGHGLNVAYPKQLRPCEVAKQSAKTGP